MKLIIAILLLFIFLNKHQFECFSLFLHGNSFDSVEEFDQNDQKVTLNLFSRAVPLKFRSRLNSTTFNTWYRPITLISKRKIN